MDRKVFATLMFKLAKAVREELDSETLAVYYEKLSRYDVTRVAWAVDEAIARERKFPPVAVLLELVRAAPRPELKGGDGPKLLPEEITPPAEARRRLQGIFDELNGAYGTRLRA